MSISPERLARVEEVLGNLNPDAKILDVGGGRCPLAMATHVIDILPYGQYSKWYGNGSCLFNKDSWAQIDITKEKFPFPSKYFDFVFSSHTLEDIYNPFFALNEIRRVGRRGYIETPSFSWEITKGVQAKRICGGQHHKWCVDVSPDGVLQFTEKSDGLYRNFLFHQSKRAFYKSQESDACSFFWEDNFEYKHITNIDTRSTYNLLNQRVIENDAIKRFISSTFLKKIVNRII